MAVLATRAVAATIANLTLRVRRMIGDTDSTEANQRFSDADIRAEIDHMMAQMYSEVSNSDPSGFLQVDDMTYTASALSVAIPTAADIEGNSIYKIEDITDATAPLYIAPRSIDQLNRFSDETGWALQGHAIALRPIPTSARTLRIYTLAPFIPTTTTTSDQHALNINHEELICLGAAVRLQEVDNQVPVTRMQRLQQLWDLYQRCAARVIGPTYIKNTRVLLNY